MVIDTPSALTDIVLSLLDQSETILHLVTYESTAIHNSRQIRETFRAIGYPQSKIRYVLNRADATGGIEPEVLTAAIGRAPDFSVTSDGRLVVESNNKGVPFVLTNPAAPITRDVTRIAAALAETGAPVPAGARR